MKRLCLLAAVAFACFLPAVRADIALPVPGIERMALADAIVVGRVTGIEPIDVAVPNAPGSKDKTTYRVAVVSVTEVVLGKKETKTLRVGFVPVKEAPNPIRRRPDFSFKPHEGQAGLLFLRKHPAENLYLGATKFDFIAENDKEHQALFARAYADELKHARRLAKIFADPIPALKASAEADRWLAATNLLVRYRGRASAKTVPISAEESKLILTALVEHNWEIASINPSAWQFFQMVGLTEKDGWKAATKINGPHDLRAVAQAWLRDHGQSYRIQRFVSESAK